VEEVLPMERPVVESAGSTGPGTGPGAAPHLAAATRKRAPGNVPWPEPAGPAGTD
jgi:hypothetical protein